MWKYYEEADKKQKPESPTITVSWALSLKIIHRQFFSQIFQNSIVWEIKIALRWPKNPASQAKKTINIQIS